MEAGRVAVGRGRVVAVSRRSVAALAVVLSAVVVAGCGGDDSPSSDDVQSGAVATIGDVEITTDALDEQVDALTRAQRPPAGSPGSGDGNDAAAKAQRDQLEAQALSMLLMREALEQEAADGDIDASLADARARWEPIASRQFKTKKALRRFPGGQTEADLLAQLRLQILAERINAQVAEQAGGGKQGKQVVKKHRTEFRKRWQDQTACANGYTANGCNEDKTE